MQPPVQCRLRAARYANAEACFVLRAEYNPRVPAPSAWDAYPPDYRAAEVRAIVDAITAGECVSVIGLSGSGKSNLMGFLAQRVSVAGCRLALIDCNRLPEHTPQALLRLIRCALREDKAGDCLPVADELGALERTIAQALTGVSVLALLLDRFDALPADGMPAVAGNLRALRDAHKFHLALVIATRRPLPPQSELAELFYANTIWLGPLSERDARWNIARFAARKGAQWDEETARQIIALSQGYPSMLRAVCEAHAAGAGLTVESLLAHPAVAARVDEFWSDTPDNEALRRCRLTDHPLLMANRPPVFDTARLTAKENSLLNYFLTHPNTVCEKDDLIRAVWPEDRVYQQGIRDDSLAQLVRRLREKIEPNPSAPRFVHTVPGRGYRFTPGSGA